MERKHLDIKRDGEWIIASTPDVDRDRDRVMPMGLTLDNYRKNPVLFYGHSYSEPWSLIGKAAEIEQDSTGIRIRAELREPASDTDPMHIVKALWESGLLRAASIGFQPLDAQPNEKGGRDIHRAELMEISLVPIPANQNALRLAAKAMDLADTAAGFTEIPPSSDDASPYAGTSWHVHIVNTLADTDAKAADEVPVSPVVDAATEAPDEAAADDTVVKADEDSAEVQAVIDARMAAILADFVESVRPYLLQS